MTGAQIAGALRLRRAGDGRWQGQCPCCGYKSGFAVTERRGGLPLLYCHVNRCTFADIAGSLRKMGIWPEREPDDRRPPPPWQRAPADKPPSPEPTEAAGKAEAAQAAALAIWGRSRPIEGTAAETHLRQHRGYTGPLPGASVLRIGSCRHRSDGAYHPALVAAVCLDGDPTRCIAVHRTFLRRDGRGKADLDPSKMTLGPCKGGAIPLAPAGSIVAIAEGIESGLSYMQMTGTPTWAALSAGGIRNLILPGTITEIVIAADPDPVGMMAARAAAQRWLNEGRRVSIARPPQGRDFNDLAREVAA
jgi:putative DNA primase/helicase